MQKKFLTKATVNIQIFSHKFLASVTVAMISIV